MATVYSSAMKIYIKPACPFCIRLLSLLDERDLKYESIDVITHPHKNEEMMKKSWQRGVPEVEVANVIIPDYGTEETLVEDIQTILAAVYVNEEVMKKLTSTIVYLA
jgi:glutaredoxin 3